MRTLSMTAIRRKYAPRILRLLASIKAACEEAGYIMDDPFEMSDEEYEWMLSGRRPGSKGQYPDFDITLTIIESKFNDGEDDFGINFSLGLTGYEGEIIGGLTPYNYTDRVWVSRKDPEAVAARWQLFADACDPLDIIDSLGKHFASRAKQRGIAR